MATMSFDIFFQRFAAGEHAAADAQAVASFLAPFIDRRDPHGATLRTNDGDAELYGLDDIGEGCMITHASGRAIWDVMYELARVGRFVVIPVGCGTCIPPTVDRSDLVVELPEPITVVGSGRELLAVVLGTASGTG